MGGPCIDSRGRSWHNQLLDGYEFEVFFLQDVDDLKGGLHTGFGGIVEEDDVEFICFAQNAAGYKASCVDQSSGSTFHRTGIIQKSSFRQEGQAP